MIKGGRSKQPLAKKRRRRTKAENQRYHAKKRAKERYDLELNRAKLEELVSMIQNGEAVKYDQRSLRSASYIVIYEFQYLRIVYDRHRKTIVTFLPLPDDAIEHYHGISRVQSAVSSG